MFWFIIVIACLVAWSTPWSFKYLVMMPFLGICLGGFMWGIVGLVVTTSVVSMSGFMAFIFGGMLLVGLLIHRYDP